MRQLVVMLLSISILILAGCNPLENPLDNTDQRRAAMIDWADFVRLSGITYVPPSAAVGRAVDEADLGPEVARVGFMLSGNVSDPGYQAKDGDAAFLPRGTSIYSLQGYRPEFRVAAWRDGQLVLYEADTNPAARVGADLLDLAGKVERIGINSPEDGRTELGSIDDPEQVAALVEQVLTAPVDQAAEVGGEGSVSFIAFHLADGTATVRGFSAGQLARGILLPPSFGDAIAAAVE